MSDNYALGNGILSLRFYVIRKALSSFSHDIFIHPVRSRAKNSAQSRSSKLHLTNEPFLYLGIILGYCDKLGSGLVVNIWTLDPGFIYITIIHR